MLRRFGKNLRRFLTEDIALHTLLDFGSVSVFEAAVNTCIIVVKKHLPFDKHAVSVAILRNVELDEENLREEFQAQAFPMPVSELSSEGWTFAPPVVLAILEKLQSTGIPLSQSTQNHFYSGIYTVYDFIIDASTREHLIAADPNSNQLIKPVLRGRDTRKWRVEWANLYMIVLESSSNREWPWSDAENEETAERIFSETYPSVYCYLEPLKEQLSSRSVQGKFYWELGPCSYYTEFEKPKIIYPDVAKSLYVSYDTTGIVNLNSTWLMPTEDLSLLALLGSRLFDWYARHKFMSLDDPWAGGRLVFKKIYMDKVPIADRTPAQKAELSHLVEHILEDPDSDEVPDLERKIDALVYRLYGLTEDEIALIEQTYQDAGMPV